MIKHSFDNDCDGIWRLLLSKGYDMYQIIDFNNTIAEKAYRVIMENKEKEQKMLAESDKIVDIDDWW